MNSYAARRLGPGRSPRVTGCGATAHVCSWDEVARMAQIGAWTFVGTPEPWVSAPLAPRSDCAGFTVADAGDVGSVASGDPAAPILTAVPCNFSRPLACCR